MLNYWWTIYQKVDNNRKQKWIDGESEVADDVTPALVMGGHEEVQNIPVDML